MPKRLILTFLAVAMLAGCASPTPASAPVASPPPVDPNIAACREFDRAFTNQSAVTASRRADENTVEEWTEVMANVPTDYAAASLIAEGDVKSRIEDLIDLIDANPAGMRGINFMSEDFDLYGSYLDRIGQACTASGWPLAFESTSQG